VASARQLPIEQGYFRDQSQDREVNRKAIPRISVSVLYVRFKAAAQGCRQADVVQLSFSIERVNSGVATDELSNQFRMTFQQISRDVF
jgi:hypothetical protein